MPALRQSALLLHGLCEADQRWILSRVARDDARVLRAHLRELKLLGIPADPGLASSAVPVAAASGTAGSDDGTATVLRASVAELHLALAGEPAWIVARLLALRPWPWRGAFLDGLAPAHRAAIETAPSPALAPRAAEGLVTAVATAVRAQRAPATGLFGAARQTLRRWF